MLTFKKVRYRNFLATGNVFSEIALDAQPRTLVVGKNGNGKTTFLDAICYALYGKAFRNINKPSLINSTNQKAMLVEIEFSTQNNEYLVRRGMKPNVFEIICNGQPIPTLPSIIEMQDYLERYVLKCNYKAFTQVVILGTSSYVPFMRLTPQIRREVIENVLDIEIFGVMNSLLKARLSAAKDSLNAAQSGYAIIESQHKLAANYAEEWERGEEARRKDIQVKIANSEAYLVTIQSDLDALDLELGPHALVAAKLNEWQEQYTKASKLVSKFSTQKQHIQNSHKFFDENDQCTTCNQIIDADFKATQLGEMDAKLLEIEIKLTEARDITSKLEANITKGKLAQAKVGEINSQILHLKNVKHITTKDRDRLIDDLNNSKASTPPPIQLGDLDAACKAVEDWIIKKNVLEHGYGLLKDNGIRTKIVNQYLPIINKTVNKYLSALDFPIQFVLDEQFNETIKSRGRDEFTYENFSEGEKRRIDLAIILTWRDIAKLKNSVACNILVFDEIFDSSLDSDGTDDFMRLLQKMDVGTNVFVVSHKTDILSDKFPATLVVTKNKGFSEIKVS